MPVDGLTGFTNAIEAVYPQTEIQQCIIHQIRITTRFVSYKDIKKLMADLKLVYAAVDEQTALYELDQFEDKWKSKYPKIAQSWHSNWPNLATYFKYPQEVRTLIYTTNAIENFNRQLRKVTKSKSVFPTDDSLLKMLYLAMIDITKSGLAVAGIGALFIHSSRSFLETGLTSNPFFATLPSRGRTASTSAPFSCGFARFYSSKYLRSHGLDFCSLHLYILDRFS